MKKYIECLLVGFSSIALYGFLVHLDVFERLVLWSRAQEAYEVDELFIFFPVVIFAISVLFFQKWKQSKRLNKKLENEIIIRTKLEEENRTHEEKIARLQKMESLGLMVGGVAHDLNNVLAGIISYPSYILEKLPEDSQFRKPLQTIEDSGNRAAAIVQDMLTMARGVTIQKEPLGVNSIILDYLQSPELQSLKQFHPAVTIKTDLDSDLFNISGYHLHISKVVMNLVSNASEAIQTSGNVTLSTSNRKLERPLIGYDEIPKGDYVVLTISDDGPGIPPDDLEKIFEPFYTKKVMGRSGTGLGLTIVWNAIHDHDGYINVSSNQNGTTFELYFPVTLEAVANKASHLSTEDGNGAGETVLSVEDDESHRKIAFDILET